VIGWGGMRGVLSLAVAESLPYALPDGRMFPQRSMIIYLAFCLIVATLVVEGLTLPWLIRRLGLSETGRMNSEEQEGGVGCCERRWCILTESDRRIGISPRCLGS
jgi:NhaP-type Na+/H+ or K+/H+ antiporter